LTGVCATYHCIIFGKDRIAYAKLRFTGKNKHQHVGRETLRLEQRGDKMLVSITTRIIGRAFACADHKVRLRFPHRFLS
jgi:hypothetical protein